jgi:hypothetical protein
MTLHPAIELLIKSVNSDKPYNKENLTKWCSSLPKEEKDFFTTKIKENVSKEELISILQSMKQPGPKPEGVPQPTPKKNVPTVYKKGDVLMHPVFQHPYILLEKKDEFWLCALITSEPTCPEILEQCKSRFFADGFITRTMFTTVDPIGRFMYPYENSRQLNLVSKKLKTLFV